MQIVTVVGAHNNPDCLLDTVDSILTHVGGKVLIVFEGSAWEEWGKDLNVNAYKISGCNHKSSRSPYRNVAIGIKTACDVFEDFDWLCYTEYDCLWTSDGFKRSLEHADQQGVWMLGSGGHIDHVAMPLIESMLGIEFRSVYYLLGACQFFSKAFMSKLSEINFFDKFLNLTNGLSDKIPQYGGYDISEHMYPTLARHFGGHIGVFSSYEGAEKKWHGNYEMFPIRWRPELDPELENFSKSSIMHPLKEASHPIRVYHREKRCLEKEKHV